MLQAEEDHSQNKVKTNLVIFLFATLILAAEVTLFFMRWIVLAILIGIGLSVLFSPVLKFLKHRLKVPHGVSAFLFFILLLGSISGIAFLLYAVIADQLVPLLQKLPELTRLFQARIYAILGNYPSLQKQAETIDFADTFGHLTQSILQGLKLGASAIGGFIFTLVLALYLAINPSSYLSEALSLFPTHQRPRMENFLRESASTFRHWFSSQLIAMATVGSATGLGLWAIGVDYWLLFGVLTAILDIVPYIGPIISALGAIVVTFAANPSKVVWVVGLYVLMQQLEGHLVIPLVMKKRIDLPPAHLLVMMVILGHWFGILGLLVAPGLLAVGRNLLAKRSKDHG